ncbi:MAG: C4-type zinc ribbon domain-containing protein [Prevotellaceae bacterium]|jgi:predicted  nucleic acid-binding Zn-ribbon protein|nr:C4-type zinc ribbon domain-containing protein [Prevotellaceae bacterium]
MAEKTKKTEAKKVAKTSSKKATEKPIVEKAKTEKSAKTKSDKSSALSDLSSVNKLRLLYELQVIDSSIDNIRTVRGELPLEVQDLEDEIVGFDTRIKNMVQEIREIESNVSQRKIGVETSKNLIKKYEEQQKNVRNNREFDSLSKELEFQSLEIELNEKNIKELGLKIKEKKREIETTKALLSDKKIALDEKRHELSEITSETAHDEKELISRTDEIKKLIEPRLLTAYNKIRHNARNGLAVVTVKRDACGGCFNKIPPQRQLDIKLSKKVIVCEYCGRILVDADFAGE